MSNIYNFYIIFFGKESINCFQLFQLFGIFTILAILGNGHKVKNYKFTHVPLLSCVVSRGGVHKADSSHNHPQDQVQDHIGIHKDN